MLQGDALAGFALLGLAGSLHCVGMCGGFVLAATGHGRTSSRVLSRALVFGLGKALTYAVLGVSLALVVGRALETAGDLTSLRRIAAWVAGGLMVLLGLSGLFRRPLSARLASPRLARIFATLHRRTEDLGGAAGAFAAGVVTGFLPCGLSWGAFVLATQVEPPTAAVGLFFFGLATTPALAALAVGWGLVSTRRRAVGARVLGLLLIVFGVVTVTRGSGPREARAGEEADCHATPTAPGEGGIGAGSG